MVDFKYCASPLPLKSTKTYYVMIRFFIYIKNIINLIRNEVKNVLIMITDIYCSYHDKLIWITKSLPK